MSNARRLARLLDSAGDVRLEHLDNVPTSSVGGFTGAVTPANIKSAYEGEPSAFTDAQFTKLSGIESGATADQTDAEIKSAYENNADTNVFSDSEKSKLAGIEASATADQTDAEIKTAYEANANTNAFDDAAVSKLAGIESSATADQTGAEIKSLYEVEANAFTDVQFTKLASIEASATADQTGAEIKSLYELETNAFTDAQFTKLAAIEALADVTDTTNVVNALSAGTGVAISAAGEVSVTAVALTTVQAAADEAAHLALTAQEGDIVVRSDENKSYVHNGGTASTMADYTLLATPTDAVLSVAGNTGVVTSAQIKAAYEGEANTNVFDDAAVSKLAGIEASATADQTDAEIKAGYEANADTNAFNDAAVSKLAGIEANATADQTDAEIKAGYEANADTNVFNDAAVSKLAGIEANATADQTKADIEALGIAASSITGALPAIDGSALTGLVTDPVMGGDLSGTSSNAQLVANSVTDTELNSAKLNAIESGATADQTDAEIKAGYEANADTNAFNDAAVSKLAGIEDSATADQTGAEIKAAYQAEANAFTDAQFTKLAGVEALADVTDTTNVVAALSAGTGVAISAAGEVSVTAVAITTVQSAIDETAHLALTAQEGDVVVRSDENKSYVHNGGTAGTMADYTVLATPTDAVLSVNGQTGAITSAQIKTAYEGEANAFTDAQFTKLAGIETGATADQTKADIEGLGINASSLTGSMPAIDGSALTGIDSLPSQTGNAGTYLQTDGTNATWGTLGVNGVDNSVEYTATAGQTSFAAVYTVGKLNVFMNGVKLDNSDYTATNGADVVLVSGASVDDNIFIQSFGTFNLLDVYTKGDSDALLATAVADLVDSAPGTLDTLNELAVALGNDNDFATTMTNSLAGKVDNAQVLTNVPAGALFTDTNTTYGVGDAGLTEKNFTSALNTKLAGIEASANNYSHPASHTISEVTGLQTALDNINTDLVNDTTPQLGGDLDLNGHVITGLSTDPTMGGDLSGTASNAQIAANAVTDTELNSAKLNGIEAGATADQTQSDINALGITATSVDLGNWTITESAGVVYFATAGVNKMKIDPSGNLTCVGDVTAFGTI